jgi:hypothetical protein
VLVAGLGVRLQGLVPVLRPLQRAAQQPRGRHHRHLVGVDERLHPERPADVLGEHPHGVLRHPQQPRVQGLQHLRRLRRHPDGQGLLVGVEGGEHAPGLQRDGGVPGGPDGDVDDRVGSAEGLLDVPAAERRGEAEVGPEVLVHQRAARRQGRRRVEDRRRLVDVDHDEVGGVLRHGPAGGRHQDDGLADVADDVGRERGLLAGDHARPGQQAAPARAQGREIGRGEHGEDAGQRPRGRGVDARDPPGGDRGPDEGHDGLPRLADVVDEAPPAGQQLRVLGAPHRPADVAGAGHRAPSACPPSSRAAAAAARTASTIVW